MKVEVGSQCPQLRNWEKPQGQVGEGAHTCSQASVPLELALGLGFRTPSCTGPGTGWARHAFGEWMLFIAILGKWLLVGLYSFIKF